MVLSRRFLYSACKCNCTSLPLRKTEWTGNTDVDIGLEMAVGTLVACDSVDRALTCLWALTCHWPEDALVLAAYNPAFSIACVS